MRLTHRKLVILIREELQLLNEEPVTVSIGSNKISYDIANPGYVAINGKNYNITLKGVSNRIAGFTATVVEIAIAPFIGKEIKITQLDTKTIIGQVGDLPGAELPVADVQKEIEAGIKSNMAFDINGPKIAITFTPTQKETV